jgi:hypothetical protein
VKDVSTLSLRRPVDRGFVVAWDLQRDILARWVTVVGRGQGRAAGLGHSAVASCNHSLQLRLSRLPLPLAKRSPDMTLTGSLLGCCDWCCCRCSAPQVSQGPAGRGAALRLRPSSHRALPQPARLAGGGSSHGTGRAQLRLCAAVHSRAPGPALARTTHAGAGCQPGGVWACCGCRVQLHTRGGWVGGWLAGVDGWAGMGGWVDDWTGWMAVGASNCC